MFIREILRTFERQDLNREDASCWYDRLIPRGAKVLVVGPSKTLAYDPSSVYAAQSAGASGELLICDPQSSTSPNEKPLFRVRGYGDGYVITQQLEQMRALGLDMPAPVWLGSDSYAQSLGIEDNSVDCIVDHGVSPFVAGSLADASLPRMKTLLDI